MRLAFKVAPTSLRNDPALDAGRAIATVLTRAWAETPLPLDPGAVASSTHRLLVQSGAGALYWRRIAAQEGAPSLVYPLRDHYRSLVLASKVRALQLAETVAYLRKHEIESLLIKGWAIARSYPHPALRPYGDLDLCVADADYVRSGELLAQRSAALTPVELHPASGLLGDLRYGDLFPRSTVHCLDGTEIRIPSPEQHLRLLALHYLKHGGWRPLWLCDLAVAMEQRPPDFDWDRCFHGRSDLTAWLRALLHLSAELLGARLSGTPLAEEEMLIPRWLAPEMLRTWGRGLGSSVSMPASAFFSPAGIRTGGLREALQRSWRNNLQAAFELGLPPGDFPQLPLRVAASAMQLPRLIARASRSNDR